MWGGLIMIDLLFFLWLVSSIVWGFWSAMGDRGQWIDV